MQNNENKETNLEQELEKAAMKYADNEFSIKDENQMEDCKRDFRKGATSDIAKKIHQKGMLDELSRRQQLIISEPSGVVRETMIYMLLADL